MRPRLLLIIAAVLVFTAVAIWIGYQRRHNEVSASQACHEAGGRWAAESRTCEGALPEG